MCEVLIVHTSEAEEWAKYLQTILEASEHFPNGSIVLYLADRENSLQECDFPIFYTCKSILLLLSAVFIDLQSEPEVLETFQRHLQPSHKVVAFLCGVSECDVYPGYFEHWESWRKIHADDDPSLYVSTVLESIADGSQCVAEEENQVVSEGETTPHTLMDDFPEPPDFVDVLPEDTEPPLEDGDAVLSQCNQSMSSINQACLTVQPDRIQCGMQVNIFIILINKLDNQANMEVELTCKGSATKRVQGIFVNEYTFSIQSPDMPAGNVSLTLYSNESIVCSTSVTYFTAMEEISCYLKKVIDPLEFMCQAFNITSNVTESLDSLLTDSLKCQMPASGLHVFGISQLEQENTSANERNEELPTLLHFAAKYGLTKLTTVLLQCPGALQAYSVANKSGDYPNTLAQKSGFSDLRQFMDKYVETADMVKSNIIESMATPVDEEIYEHMSNSSQDLISKYSLQEDIYESMMELNPDCDCMEDLYEDMASALGESLNPEEAMLRKFFQVKPGQRLIPVAKDLAHKSYHGVEMIEEGGENLDSYEEEDPYNMIFPEQIYDTVDEQTISFAPEVLNRPPAPIPRPSMDPEHDDGKTYISRVFPSKDVVYSETNLTERGPIEARPVRDRPGSDVHDSYAGMKTPGQRQLIALQQRVKVGALSVEEAVQEFKAWQFDQDGRSQSLRFQQDNLQRLRDSITRRHKEKGKETDLEITAPIQKNLEWGSCMNIECAVYEPSPLSMSQPPLVTRPIQRGTWQTGSTSSTSSSGSNRLSTLSTISSSSAADGEFEDVLDTCPAPPRPPRITEVPPVLPPPRIPRRLPERTPENMIHERYISSPTRILPQTPPHRPSPPPPIPRRTR